MTTGRMNMTTCAVHLLHRAGQCADELFMLNLGASDLTPRQYVVLQAAASGDDLSQTALVERTGIDRSTLADIVRRLVERGLLARKRTRYDARMYAVRLTPAGVKTLESTTAASKKTDDRLLSVLNARERAQFIEALERIISTLGPISSARINGRDHATTGS